ncbi:MAG: amino acid permease [Ignavibacteriae bacterium]|nr:amino acid permease [Ignavibacteriota bacterium]
MNKKPELRRELGLVQATALNMSDMVGIGPFVVLPIVVQIMAGPQAIWAWVAGAVLALVDGFVWAELGAAMPKAGGSFVFLRETFGRERWGKLMSFLFIWQTMIQAPLVVASGAIGFAQYFTFLVPLGYYEKKMLSGALVILIIALLYRKVGDIGKISVVLWAAVLGTIGWLIFGGATHFNPDLAFTYPETSFDFSGAFFVLLGQATVKTVYSYLGYYNVCHLGGEIRNPERNIPRSIFISIIGIAILYLALNLSVLGVIPWQEIQNSQFIVSTFVDHLYGHTAANFATGLVLLIAFSSLFAVVVGYSRIPYAAAREGAFFSIFGKLHPTKDFPYISLLFLGGIGFIFSLTFRMSEVISAILAMRIIVQFIGGAVGVMLLRRKWSSDRLPFKMWLYPVPAVMAILLWIWLFNATVYTVIWNMSAAFWGISVMILGIIVYFVQARIRGEFPFVPKDQAGSTLL